MTNEDEKWELQLEIAMLKDSMKNQIKITDEQILNPGDPNAPHNFGTREEKIAAITRDPKPQWALPPVRSYITTHLHYIICVDGDLANASMPESLNTYGVAHVPGNFLASDRLVPPPGFDKVPPKGSSIETIREKHPEAYEALRLKKVTNF